MSTEGGMQVRRITRQIAGLSAMAIVLAGIVYAITFARFPWHPIDYEGRRAIVDLIYVVVGVYVIIGVGSQAIIIWRVRWLAKFYENLIAEREACRRQNDVFRDTFIGILGHDLRNPLSAIQAGVSLVRKQGKLDARNQDALDRVMRASVRMTNMIEEMLSLAQTRLAGGIPVKREPADLYQVIHKIVDEANLAYGHRVQLQIDDEGGAGLWDGERFSQALANLLGNAIEHGEKNTPIAVHAWSSDVRVFLEVHNEGVMDHPGSLFEPFRPRNGRKKSGLGLGLYITNEIVRAHGGAISVVSTPDVGTTFRVEVPKA